MKEYLFIYGTLLPDHAPAEIGGIIGQLRPVGPASVPGYLYDFGQYPGAVLNNSARTRIAGQVFELSQDGGVLKALDSYEGYKPDDLQHSLFIRERAMIALDDGEILSCWIYLYNRDPGTAPLVSGGDYTKSRAA